MASRTKQDVRIDDLREQLDGELISPDEPSYDERDRSSSRASTGGLAVARVAGAADVAAVVRAAREGGLELAVRSGGTAAPATARSTAAWSSTSPE